LHVHRPCDIRHIWHIPKIYILRHIGLIQIRHICSWVEVRHQITLIKHVLHVLEIQKIGHVFDVVLETSHVLHVSLELLLLLKCLLL